MTRAEAIRDLLTLFCGSSPAIHVDRVSKLSQSEYERLQSFVASELRLPWLTGIGVLEAIDTLVDEAVANSEMAFAAARPVLPKRIRRYSP